jgi:predicted LPLAT superfamily acyltransferase
MAPDAVARPHWYSHGLNRLVYYRMAGAAASFLPRRARLGVAQLAGRIALASMVATLERAVRAHPTQWFNFFDVWSPPRVAA